MATKELKHSARVIRRAKKQKKLSKTPAGSSHKVVVHDKHNSEVASIAKQYGVRSVPAIVIHGILARCCAGRGPDEHILGSAQT